MSIYINQIIKTAALLAVLSLGAAHAATPPDTLVIARDIGTFISVDPQEAFEIASGDTLNNLYLRLVQHDPRDYKKIIPGAAESWQAAPDGKQIVFKIKAGLKFQSGDPVTADDAAFSLRRGIQLGKPPSIILRQFGWVKDNVEQHVRAEGNQLILTFDKPYSTDLILSALSATIGSVVDKKLVMANEHNGDLGNGWLKTHSAGAGAYKLVEWKAKDAVVLEAFPGYSGGAPKLKRVIIRHVAEAAAQRLLLEKGDVDVASDLNPDQVQALGSKPDLKVLQIARGTVHYLALNQANPVLAKPEVWQAIRWLIDYDGIANQLFRGQYKTNQSPVAQGVVGALPEQPYKLDVAKAKALLVKAGLKDGFSISMDVMAMSPYREMAQSLQNTFAQAGIKLDLKVAEPTQVLTRYRERRHDLIVFVWAPDYSDASSTIEFFTRNADNTDGALNKNAAWRNRWLIPQLTAKTEVASHETDGSTRMQRYGDLQRVLRDDSPFVFMVQKIEPIAMRKNVSNYSGFVTFDSTPFHIIEKR
jgi:peptide/nickel transport system substrate-binding protein